MKPMLAAAVKDADSLPYPMIASPKLDGIRCVIVDGKALSRSLKPIPNEHVRNLLESMPLEGFDGELMVEGTFQDVSSAIMSHKGTPEFTYFVFDDMTHPTAEYTARLENLTMRLRSADISSKVVQFVPVQQIPDARALLAYEMEILEMGFEGVCLRTPSSPYKYGRSTLKQAWLLKLKQFVDAEAKVLQVDEQYRNTNAAEKDELGHTKRSHAKEGKEGKGTMGRFKVRDLATGVEFHIGTGIGLTDALRQTIWDDRQNQVGRIVKYKSQPFGAKDAPRIPIFLGFRDENDL